MKLEHANILNHLFECSNNHVFVIEPKSAAVVIANHAALNFLQVSSDELADLSLTNIFPDYSKTYLHNLFDELLLKPDEQLSRQTVERSKSGKEIHVELYFCSFTENLRPYIMVSAADITPSIIAEKTANAHLALYRSISDAIVSTDTELTITAWNKFAEELFEYTEEEAIGTSFKELIAINRKGKTIEDVTKQVFTQNIWKGEVTVHRRNKHSIPALITISALRDHHNKIIGSVSTVRDISSLKQKSRKIEKLAEMVNQSNDVILCINRALKIESWNKGAERIYGYTAEEVLGKDFVAIIRPAISGGAAQEVLQEIDKKGHITFEDVHITKPGEHLNMLISVSPLSKSKNNNYDEYLVVAKDITQHKHLQQALEHEKKNLEQRVKEKTSELENILNRITDGFLALNTQLHCIYANATACKIANVKPGALFGKHLSSVFPETVSQNYLVLAGQALDSMSTVEAEDYFEALQKWIHLSIYPDQHGVSIYLQDTTNRRRTEEALQKSEKRLSQIYDAALHPMCLLKVKGARKFQYESINAAYETVFGVTKSEVLGHYFGQFMPLADLEKMILNLNTVVQTRQVQRFVTENIIKGRSTIIEVTAVPILAGDGSVDQILVSADDITRNIQSQDALLQKNIQLQELTSHLHNIREEERAAVAREIHDELGQQLTGLKMDLSWLQRNLQSANQQVARKLQGSLELADLTIATVRRISTELHPSILDDLGLPEAIDWYSSEFSERTGIEVRFRSGILDEKLPPEVSIALYRIYQEALTNVARHAGATQINGTLTNANNNLTLTIADNGKGFDIANKKGQKSLGLLSMRERATMLNGFLNIESYPQQGTTITVTVPLNGKKPN